MSFAPQLLVIAILIARILAGFLTAAGAVEVKPSRCGPVLRYLSLLLYNATAQLVLYWGGFYDELIRRLA